MIGLLTDEHYSKILKTVNRKCGTETAAALSRYNFTKRFMGAGGISVSGGYNAPNSNEDAVKTAAIVRSRGVLTLGGNSKFGKNSDAKFAEPKLETLITDKVKEKKYLSETVIKEAL